MTTGLEAVHDVYQLEPQHESPAKHHLVGRYLTDGKNVEVLADYHGYLGGIQDGPVNTRSRRLMDHLQHSPYFRTVNLEDYRQGHHPDLIPEAEMGDMHTKPDRPPSIFDYTHPLIGGPVTLEAKDGQLRFNGKSLNRDEATRIVQCLRNGTAQIRYKRSEAAQAVAKAEEAMRELSKTDPGLDQALSSLRDAAKQGHLHPDVVKRLTQEIFTDPMVKGVGNKKAYADFLSRPREGVHVRIDGANFGTINKVHGFEMGNKAIVAMGDAMREAIDESVGRKVAKLFRIGGDEFHLHVPTHEHAAIALRAMRKKLEAIPPVGGTHNLALSAGFGTNPDEAEAAMIDAKTHAKKNQPGYFSGQAKTHAASRIPGHEGIIPLDPEVGLVAPPKEARESSAGTSQVQASPAK